MSVSKQRGSNRIIVEGKNAFLLGSPHSEQNTKSTKKKNHLLVFEVSNTIHCIAIPIVYFQCVYSKYQEKFKNYFITFYPKGYDFITEEFSKSKEKFVPFVDGNLELFFRYFYLDQ